MSDRIEFAIENTGDDWQPLLAYRNGEPVDGFGVNLDEGQVRDFLQGWARGRFAIFVEGVPR